MELQYKRHIEMRENEHPLEVRLTERPVKAYMVANLAFIDGIDASAEHYQLSLGAVYAAMSFYEDNRQAIEKALQQIHDDSADDRKASEKRVAEIRRRMNNLKK
ncbi:MAG: hypothetical protein AAF846_20930 [Chloroflexota bacterium]